MRPSIKDLYKVDPVTLADLNAVEYHKEKIRLLKNRRSDIVSAMDSADDYEKLSHLNNVLRYIDKALSANQSDLEELTGETLP